MQEQDPLSKVTTIRNISKKPKTNELSQYVFGKVQPQALPLEEAVLGALLIDKDGLTSVMDVLSADSFYSEAHKSIYKAIMELFQRNQPVDLLTVTEQLRLSGELEQVGGAYYLVQLTNRVASSANIEYHARIVSQKHIQRELIRVSTTVIKDAYEDTTDVFDLLDKAEQDLFDITQNNLKKGASSMSSLAAEVQKKYEEAATQKSGVSGVPSGFHELDKVTSGWQPSDLIIVAARPGMGKTSFTLALARNAAADFKKPVAFFSLEMSAVQLAQRLISLEGEISGPKIRNGKLEPYEVQQLNATINKVSEYPIFIDDTPGINIFELRAKCRRLKSQYDIQMVIIDYLQLMTAGGDKKNGNREQEISTISRGLKGLAKDLNIPVMALSQLNRTVESRGSSKKPQLSDLRESGAIEQDADIVSFIFRPEYYDILEDEQGGSTEGLAEIIIAKHRNGALETVQLGFEKEYAKFKNLNNVDFNAFMPKETSSSKLGNTDNGGFMKIPSKANTDFDPGDDDFDFGGGFEDPMSKPF